MTSAHTPGPWFSGKGSSFGFIFSNTAISHIGSVNRDLRRAEANARLIAAAPELLASCKALLAELPSGHESLDLMVRQVIAKIEDASSAA